LKTGGVNTWEIGKSVPRSGGRASPIGGKKKKGAAGNERTV